MKKKLIMMLAVLGFTMLLTGCAKTEVDLANYLSISFSGYDTMGTATVEFDVEDMVTEYMDNFKLSMSDDDEDWEDVYDELTSNITLSLDQSKDLSNGDRVTCDVEISEAQAKKWAKEYKIAFVYEEAVDKKVKGLEELVLFDPFDYTEIYYNGYSSVATAYVDYWSSYSLEYELDKTENLTNGDIITVKVLPPADASDMDIYEYCAIYGIYPESITKEYTVSGLRELTERDPFDEIYSVEFCGNNHTGDAVIDYVWWMDYAFTVDKTDGLSNGDVITITVGVPSGYDDMTLEEYALSLGERLTSTKQQYVVEGLTDYATSLSQIPAEAMTAMDEAGRLAFQDYVDYEWNDPSYFYGLKPVGYCMAMDNYDGYGNNIYFVYQVKANSYQNVPIENYYTYACFGAVDLAKPVSECVDLDDVSLPYGYAGWFYSSGAIFEVDDYAYTGYQSLEELWSDIQDDPNYTTYEVVVLTQEETTTENTDETPAEGTDEAPSENTDGTPTV